MRQQFNRAVALWGFIFPLAAHAALPEETVTLLYVERPPLMMRSPDGAVSGVLADSAKSILTKADIPFVWREVSPNRELAVIQNNNEPVCAVGRYKTSERQAYSKFTNAIYRDSSHVGVANLGLRVPDKIKAADLLGNPDVTLLIRDGYVLPASLQNLVDHMRAKRVGTYGTYAQMIGQVVAGKAQLAILTEEEEAYFRKTSPASSETYRVVHFSDVPLGEKRYLMCSKAVSDAVIEKINAQLK